MRAMPVVLVLFVACLIPELILSGADYGLWGDPGWRLWAWQHGGFWTGLLGNWRPNYAAQPWLMFLTYGFLHGGVIHFGVNMLTLFSLAPPLVERMGQGRFLLLYMASMIGGGLGFALLSQSPQPMVGASGALFGLAGAVMALSWQYLRARGESLRPVIRSLLWLAGLNLVLWWAMSGMLAWETHLGGFVVGWLMGLWLVRDGR
ncbi:rhomboid family intramembrane serine protease (plasmid) [Haematobacter massiliensis]|uniref:Rhomboid family intramembrane serine protease n=2 Tax=Paracoccaceae TaxID=31989 RepID=A0A212AB38_9RHOB|nr:rhomboid family intramembrane serine protease [Haematobacter genomosp. 1]QBJ22866.1 rhomboid family intramembrane serine protease [Haematobacter massiliensis]